jgi:hypothetical protein
MANTFVKIATVTVGSGGAATMDFTSIPSTYTDLQLVYSGRSTSTGADTALKFNSTTTNYSYRILYGTGSAAASASGSGTSGYGGYYNDSGYTANTFSSTSIYIPNYTSSLSKNYSVNTVQENNATGANSALQTFLWTNSAAITSISINPSTGNWAQYSSATLYGIKNS